MTIKITPTSARKVTFPSGVFMNFLNEERITELVPAGVSAQVVDDMNVSRSSTATVRFDRQIFAAASLDYPVTFESLDEAKATVDSDGYVTPVGTGSVGILAKSKWITKRYDFTANVPAVLSVDTWVSYLSGSLGDAIHTAIQARIAASTNRNVYSVIDHVTPAYTRNASCWITADKTAWPVWNSWTGSLFCGAAVTPKHMMFAWHAGPPVGTTLRFVTNSNTVVTRTIASHVLTGAPDMLIAELDSALPGTITPCKVLPTTWQDKVSLGNLPMITGNYSQQLYIRDWLTAYSACAHESSTVAAYAGMTGNVIGGDSGSPCFVMIDNQLVVLGGHYTTTGCSFITSLYTAINAAITSSGYTLTPIDLSAYPTY